MARCGFVAIVGRPNVGKSTLLNQLLGQKISITSHKPQTTRHRILGIKTDGESQCVYVDTPGLHLGGKSAINRYMNRTAGSALMDVDAVVFVVEALRWTEEDESVARRLETVGAPVILAVNKVDTVTDKERLLPFLQEASSHGSFAEVIPISASSGSNVEVLESVAEKLLPEGVHLFSDDQITDRSERFIAAELVREKLMRTLRQELPYSVAVEIENFSTENEIVHIDAIIWVERKGHKGIIIGKGGAMLKQIGKQARLDMQRAFGQQVFLRLWVKVKEGWSDDERTLKSLGYSDDS